MSTEYRVEYRDHGREKWIPFSGMVHANEAEARAQLAQARDFYVDKTKPLRIASREVTDWVPVKTPVEEALERVTEAMIQREVEYGSTVNSQAISQYRGVPLFGNDIITIVQALKDAQS